MARPAPVWSPPPPNHHHPVSPFPFLRERHARGMLDALQDGPVWVVPAVLGMAVTLKELCVKADAEQARKGAPVNQVRRWAANGGAAVNQAR